jgi:S1-C subfamily serine protease
MEHSTETQKRLTRRPIMLIFGLIGIVILFGALACNVSQDAAPNQDNNSDSGFGEANFPNAGSSQNNDDSNNDNDDVPPPDAPDPQVADPTRPFEAVVQIIALYLEDGELYYGWSGSGTVITPDGLILTNAHVVLPDRYYNVDALAIAFTTQEDQEPEAMFFAEVLQADAQLDIAVIRITTDLDENPVNHANLNLPYVPLGDADDLRLGDAVTILGYPGIGGETITLTRGEVSGFTSEEGYGDRAFIKTSATIAGGNSGGLAADANGYLIGVPTQLGYGGDDQYVDCRVLADTNRDGVVDENDNCVPTGGFINALRPVNLAWPLIEAAQEGLVHVVGGEDVPPPPVSGLPEAGEILFADDFSVYDEYWVGTLDYGKVDYGSEDLRFELWEPLYYLPLTTGYDYDDVIVEVDAYVINSAGDGDFGLICRYQDIDNFYGLEVSEDGYYSIWKYVNGEHIYLWEEQWRYLPFELDYGYNVHLTASCVGNTLTLAVDGELLAEAVDNDLGWGDVGMIAGTWDIPTLMIGFDNLVIYSAAD